MHKIWLYEFFRKCWRELWRDKNLFPTDTKSKPAINFLRIISTAKLLNNLLNIVNLIHNSHILLTKATLPYIHIQRLVNETVYLLHPNYQFGDSLKEISSFLLFFYAIMLVFQRAHAVSQIHCHKVTLLLCLFSWFRVFEQPNQHSLL